jgi:hypothetical protein
MVTLVHIWLGALKMLAGCIFGVGFTEAELGSWKWSGSWMLTIRLSTGDEPVFLITKVAEALSPGRLDARPVGRLELQR